MDALCGAARFGPRPRLGLDREHANYEGALRAFADVLPDHRLQNDAPQAGRRRDDCQRQTLLELGRKSTAIEPLFLCRTKRPQSRSETR